MAEIILYNGNFIAGESPVLPASDRGFTLGDSVFDTMLAIDGKMIFADKHFRRLSDHAAVMKIPFPYRVNELEHSASMLLERCNLLTGRAAIRTTISRGPAPRGLAPPPPRMPTLLMQAHGAPVMENSPPLQMIVARTVRRNEHSPLSRIKSSNYGDNLIALLEAQDAGAHDAVMLNTAGNAACATTSNIFALIGEKLVTPPLSDGVMPGITRASLMFRAVERSLTEEDLMRADALWLTSSVGGIRAVESLNGVKYKDVTGLAA
jgi:branched-chain amino acid aminotransferase